MEGYFPGVFCGVDKETEIGSKRGLVTVSRNWWVDKGARLL